MQSFGVGPPGPTVEHLFEGSSGDQNVATVHFLPPGISDPWLSLMLFTAAWCILYSILVCAIGCLNSGLRATNPSSINLTPMTPFLANNLTSLANTFLSITGVSVFAIQLKADGLSLASPRLIVGPLLEYTSTFYIAFAAYCVYDMLWVVFLQPSIDKVMLGHHVLFFAVVWLLYSEGVFSLLAAVLLLQEASSPFVCLLHVLRELGITGGKLYAANGVVMTITFGLFRGGLLYRCGPLGTSAINSRMNWRIILCITLVSGGYCLQLYWFGKIVRGMIKHVIDHEEHDCDLDLEDSQPLLKGGSSSSDRRRSESTDPMLSVRSTGDSAAGAGR